MTTGLSPASFALAATVSLTFPAFAAQESPKDGDWAQAGGNFANWRYSELDQINAGNVKTLKVAFTFSTGLTRGEEAAPIVANGLMIIVSPFPNTVFALDLSRPSAPLKWTFEPHPDPASQGLACCDTINHGAAFADGRIFFNALDGQTFALDARTGKEIWRTRLADTKAGETLTMAPLVVKGRVLIGNSGSENGVRGWLAALDAATGKTLWRAYSTGPDRDVLIGRDFKPFYDSDRGTDLGVASWPTDAWKIGGGTADGFVSYDPGLDLLYYGTAHAAPWNPQQRAGDNKWAAGVFARDLETGAARWFYQMSPADPHAYGASNENVLVDLELGGAVRKTLLHPGRNGYLYVMDRANGEVLSATPYVHITTSTGVDSKTGRLDSVARTESKPGKVVRDVCPSSPGAKNWQPSAYSPRTHLLYLPHLNLCQEIEVAQTSYIAGTPYIGAQIKIQHGPRENRGEFTAWDPIRGRKVWGIDEDLPLWSGALATAGDVVFYGTLDGVFKGVDARTGATLWQFRTGSGIVGQPIAYRGPDGKEYIAVLSGVGGWPGSVVSRDLDTRDTSAALGFANVLWDLKSRTGKGGMLYVFGLP